MDRTSGEVAPDASRERFRDAFQAAAIGMALIGWDGALLEANDAFCAIVGYAQDQLDTLTLRDITHSDDLEPYADCVRQMLDGTISSCQMEKRYVHRDGRAVWILLTASLVKDAGGTPLYVIAQVQDINDRKVAEEVLETAAAEQSATLESVRYRALHDVLTELPNRALFLDRLDQSVLLAQRESACLALLFVDLDRFKQVNDTLGHRIGDLLLQHVGHRLHEVLRESDTVARMGGDEFAIVLPGADEAGAHAIAQKILQTLEQLILIEGYSVRVGASIGIALYPEHGDSTETLMRRADVAMYVAKRARLGYTTYSPNLDVNTTSRLALAAEIHQAIDGKQLLLHYQPKIDLRSGRMSGVEALVRWRHPVAGLIPPSEFIPVAEQAGFMTPLTHWVIDTALEQCRLWQELGLPLRTAVNLSASNLQDVQTVQVIAEALARWNVSADLLEVEITESAVMEDPDRSLHILTALNRLGLHTAIDDFGAGYSSLAYLARLPVDISKIDRSFVLELTRVGEGPSQEATVVRAMIDFAHSLGLQVVAEGIENRKMLDLLTAMRCDFAQGFYLGAPVPAQDIQIHRTPASGEKADSVRLPPPHGAPLPAPSRGRDAG